MSVHFKRVGIYVRNCVRIPVILFEISPISKSCLCSWVGTYIKPLSEFFTHHFVSIGTSFDYIVNFKTALSTECHANKG